MCSVCAMCEHEALHKAKSACIVAEPLSRLSMLMRAVPARDWLHHGAEQVYVVQIQTWLIA